MLSPPALSLEIKTLGDLIGMPNRVALITGASRGLGRLIAIELACFGHDIIIVGRDKAGLLATAREVRSNRAASRIAPLQCDLAQPNAVEVVSDFARQFGPVDVL